MKIKLFDVVIAMSLFLFSSSAFSQVIKQAPNYGPVVHKDVAGPGGVVRCHTMEADSIRRANDPTLPTLEQEEAWLQQQIAIYKSQNAASSNKVVLTIPIVFHIITDGAGAENLAGTYIQAQVDQLNLDYANLSGSSYAVAADCEIQFCLAVVDPSGNPMAESGIDRVYTYGGGPFTQTQIDNTVKPGCIWDPNNYFNVWVADISGGLLGWAQFPDNSGLAGMPGSGGAANTDGVAILYSSVGSVATPNPGGGPYAAGRTLTHESGHWLGLRHIWGDGNCSVDDFCNDTPKSDAANYGCPTTNSCTDSYGAPWPTANPNDMVENYMDYTDDGCMNTFTADQKTRMQTVMSVSPRRASLASSTVCTPLIADDIGISSIITPTGTVCSGTFTPEVVLYNYGNTTVTSCNILYDIDGGTQQTYNWTGSISPLSSTNVVLSSMTTTAGAHTFNASTELPNGNTDGNSSNDANSSSFTVDLNPGTATPPIAEGFVAVAFPPTNWSLNNGGNAITWVRSGTQGTAPTAGNSAVIDNYNTNTTGDIDDIAVEPTDLSGFSSATLTFDVAYARYDGTYFDQLDVLVSVDCGQTWNTVYSKSGTTLATDPDQTAGYTSPSTWRNEVIDMTPYAGNSKVEILFRNISGWGQYLYIDNINLTGVSASVIADFTAAPDPSCVGDNVTFTDASTGASSWGWDFGAGATPATATGVGPHVVTYATSGTKTVTLTVDGGADVSVQNITVNPLDDPSYSYSAASYCSAGTNPLPTITGLTGGTFTSAPAGLTINASTGEIDLATSTPGAYTVTYTTNGTCPNSQDVTVDIFASPVAPTISASGATTFCAGGSVDLTSSQATGNVWSTTETTQAITVSASGSYTVTYTDGNGCSATSSPTVVTVNANPVVPTVTPSGSTTFCDGGSVDLTSSYSSGNVWSSSETTQAINVTTSGTYTVTYTDGNGCSATSAPTTVTVNANPTAPTITPSGATTFCAGGSVDLTSSQASGNTWSTSETTQTISVSSSGSYTVTYTDGNGCSATSAPTAVTVNALPGAPTVTASGPTTFCAGGSVTLTSSQASGNLWSTAETTQSIAVTTSGTYSVTYTDGNGCSATSTPLTVTVNPLPATPTVTPSGATTFCSGGSVTLTSSQASGNTWSTSQTTQSILVTSSGTYTVTYTDGNGCSATSAPTTVTVNPLPAAPTVSASGPTTFCAGGSVTLTSSSASNNTWSTSETTQSIVVSSSGSYTVTYTDGNGCSATSVPTTVTVNPLPSAPVITPSGSTTFCSGGSVTLTSSQGAGNVWSTGSTSSNIVVTTSGTYTVTYTDGNGCSATSAPTTVTVNPSPVIAVGTVTDPSACLTATGSIEITGSGTGTVYWSGSTSGNSGTVTLPYTITGLYSGPYSIYYIDGTGCTSNTLNQSLTDPSGPAAPTITPSGATTFCTGGSVDLTSSYATNNVWSTSETTQSITVTTSGTYTVTYVDAFGCSSTSAPVTVTVNTNPAAPVVTPLGSTTFCDGSSVDLSSSEGTGNVWSTSETTQTITATTAGSYTVTYTDGNGCSATSAPVTVTVNALPSAPTISAGGATTFCDGGSVDLTSSQASGNTWSTTETTQTITVTAGGTYTVTYTDGNGCSSTSAPTTVTVSPLPSAPTISAAGPTTFCAGGSVTLTSSQASGNLWSTSETTQTITVSSSGTYSVTYTDGNGCSATSASTSVTVNPDPTITTGTVTDPSSCGGSDGSIVVNGTGTGIVSWVGTASGNSGTVTLPYTISGLTAGSYDITFDNGCTSNTVSASLADPSAPSAPVVTVSDNCGNSVLTATGSNLMWSTSETTSSITVTSGGTYTVTQTVGGCTSAPGTGVASPLTVPSAPAVTVSDNCGSSTISATGSNLLWSTSETTSSITVTSAGTYTVTQTVGGCTSAAASAVANPIAVPSAPTVSVTDNCGSSDLSATGTNLLWSTSETTPSITVTSGGTYTVTQTVGGCTSAPGTGVASPMTVPSAPVVTVVDNCGSSDLSATGSNLLWSTSETTPTITVTSGGTYTVTQTVGGCTSAPGTGVASPFAIPSAPVITANGSTTFCEGGSVDLSSSETTGNVWSTTETTQAITVTTTGSYTVTYTDGNGCSATSSAVDVTVNPRPVVTLGAFADACLQDAAYALSGGSPNGGTYTGTGVSGGMFDPSVAGVGGHTITYTYTDINGCTDSAQVTLSVKDCAGIADLDQSQFAVYPNPTSTYLNIESVNGTVKGIKMYDAAGRLIIDRTVNEVKVILNMTEVAPGVYNLVIDGDNGSVITRITRY